MQYSHDEIRSLLEGTTEGEWKKADYPIYGIKAEDGTLVAYSNLSHPNHKADSKFLVSSKSIVRQLLEENGELKSCVAGLAGQFGYRSDDGKRLTTGGLSDLERAFHLLGWDNPHKL